MCLPIYLVIFVNEKSVILQSSLKKSVPTLDKFMVDNNLTTYVRQAYRVLTDMNLQISVKLR